MIMISDYRCRANKLFNNVSKISNVYSMVMMISVFISAKGLRLTIVMQYIKKRLVKIPNSGYIWCSQSVILSLLSIQSVLFFHRLFRICSLRIYKCLNLNETWVDLVLLNTLISPVLYQILVSCKWSDSAVLMRWQRKV